jgi:CHAD domain-containing protein
VSDGGVEEPDVPLTFVVGGPAGSMDLGAVAERVAHALGAELGPGREVRRTFLDSFDWRLWRAGETLVEEPHGDLQDDAVRLWLIRGVRLQRTVQVDARPRFAWDLPWPAQRAELARRLEMRALLPVVTVGGPAIGMSVRDERGKRVLGAEVAALAVEGRPLPVRIVLEAVRGYEAEARRASEALAAAGFAPAGPLLELALEAVGKQPGDYDSRIAVALSPDEPAQRAVGRVLARILEVLVANEAGVREDIDSEFLHDLRVAVRRTRSVLGQLKGVFPEAETERFAEDLRWLGQVTGPTRDLDVFLLDLPGLETEVGPLEPLRALVLEQREEALRDLRAALDSPRYRALIEDWSSFLGDSMPGPRGKAAVETVVTPRIRKLAKRVAREGAAIGRDTPAEAMHELRKRAKKLRYLTEFFGPLYGDGGRTSACVKQVKGLQSKLGTLQDLAVQAERVRGYAGALLGRRGVEADDLMAVGVLVDRLERRRSKLHATLAEGYDADGLRAAYAALLGDGAAGVDGP